MPKNCLAITTSFFPHGKGIFKNLTVLGCTLALSSIAGFSQSIPTSLSYTGSGFLRSAGPQKVTAVLTDSNQGLPVQARAVTFAVNSVTATAVTDNNGFATVHFDFDPEQPGGSTQLQISFGGDSNFQAASITTPIQVVQSQNFVIWGGNSVPLQVGDRVNFWGHSWADQVVDGQFAANPSFKGFANNVLVTPLQSCQANATSVTLTKGCWQTKPGNSFPPAALPSTIEVIVSTAIVKSGSNIFGNIAQCAIVQVDPTAEYGPDPGHPGFGTILSFEPDCGNGGDGNPD